jgi:hypothetical protein
MKRFFVAILLCLSLASRAQAPDYPAAPPARVIAKAEYFFDADPGQGNGTAINLTAAADMANFSTVIALNGAALTHGFHRLYLRTQDDAGRWSLTGSAFFSNAVVPVYPTAPGAAPVLADAEYFIDNDPGLGMGKKIAIPVTSDVSSLNVLVDLTGLPTGLRRLYIRTKDASGKWSLTNYALFDNSVQTPYPSAPAPAPALSQAEYYFDTDPGFGNGTPISLPSSTEVANFSFNVPVSSLAQGRHTLYLRSRQNPWSMSAYAEFMIGSTLPVSFLYAKAEATSNDALISWATGFEDNADRFEVEYSTNGTRFTVIGSVQASNNPSGSKYSFLHQSPAGGTAYYRIRQVDKDGKALYSKTVVLVIGNNRKTPLLFPNPVNDVLHVVLPKGFAVEQLELVAVDGRVVRTVKPARDQQNLTVMTGDLKSGGYLLVLKAGGKPTAIPFVKQ